jgi:shikimate kinase
MNLVLVGYRGTGKSAIARRLGELLAMPTVSLDAEIVRDAGRPIPAIVEASGWSHFRDLEEKVCRRFGAQTGIIIDCGGGVVEREANFDSLRAGGRVYWLRATPTTIVSRIGGDKSRPSLTGTHSFTEEVEDVLSRREPLYQRLAHDAVDTDGRTLDELAATIAAKYRAAASPGGSGAGEGASPR